MKKVLLFLSLITICAFLQSCRNKPAETSNTWLKVKEVADNVWQISDNGDDNMYLIAGKDSALLIDTGLGVADLESLVKKYTKKPLIVVNTHAHPDHSGANYQFERIYIHPLDLENAKPYSKPRQMPAGAEQQRNIPEEELYKGKINDPEFIPVQNGHIFNIGGRRIEVIHAPGHSAGELVLLDKENELLFTGDNTNALVWLWLPTCRPLSEYLTTLEMLQGRMSEFTTIFPGHKEPLPADFINDQVACVKGILDGSLERTPYESGMGSAMQSVFGRATVVFNPDNL
jgi:glyoxylase-like metal-dependent hydrolase (beta-lactamase superfamily II)